MLRRMKRLLPALFLFSLLVPTLGRAEEDDDDPKARHAVTKPKAAAPQAPAPQAPKPKAAAAPAPARVPKEEDPPAPKKAAPVADAPAKKTAAPIADAPAKKAPAVDAPPAPPKKVVAAEPVTKRSPAIPADPPAAKSTALPVPPPASDAPATATPGARAVRVRLVDGSTVVGQVRAEQPESLVIDCALGQLAIPRLRISTIAYDAAAGLSSNKRAPVQQLDDDLPPPVTKKRPAQ